MLINSLVAMVLLAIAFPLPVLASGVIVDVAGDVKATLPGQPSETATSGMELPDGSKLVAGGDGSASVLLDTGALDQISAGSSYTLGGQAETGKRTSLGGGIAIAMRELSSEGEGPTVHGMVRETERKKSGDAAEGPNPNMVSAIYPRRTTIELGRNITFQWEKTPPIDWESPVIVVDDESRNHIAVLPMKKFSTELTVPVSSAKLVKGKKYSWYPGTSSPKVKGKTARYDFETASVNDEKELKVVLGKIAGLSIGPDGKGLLMGQAYYSDGFYMKAVETLEPLYAKNPSPFVRKLLWQSWKKMGQSYKAPK